MTSHRALFLPVDPEVDIVPATLIWDDPEPVNGSTRSPEPFLRPREATPLSQRGRTMIVIEVDFDQLDDAGRLLLAGLVLATAAS